MPPSLSLKSKTPFSETDKHCGHASFLTDGHHANFTGLTDAEVLLPLVELKGTEAMAPSVRLTDTEATPPLLDRQA